MNAIFLHPWIAVFTRATRSRWRSSVALGPSETRPPVSWYAARRQPSVGTGTELRSMRSALNSSAVAVIEEARISADVDACDRLGAAVFRRGTGVSASSQREGGGPF